MAEWENGLFALPPGVDFADEFVAGFLKRMAAHPPEDIARVTIYANSGRTLTAMKLAFDRRGPLLLPKMRVVTDLGAGSAKLAGPLVAPLARRLELARLIARYLEARPDLAAGHSVPALARSLTDLMTEMQTEGCGPEALEAIDTGDHARHWQNALVFLRIAADFFLATDAPDRAARQRLAAESMIADWTEGRNLPTDPIIVAGSTGSHGATRMFMQAVAGLPNGAVVLPGFDHDQPASVWDGIISGAEDHPQARYAPLIEALGYPRNWSDRPAPAPERNALVSLALRPAPVTDQWIAEGPQLPDLIGATRDVTLIEADQPGQEAEAIALVMREAAQRQQPVTLIAADSGLIRRVNAALDRWQLRADDSAGRPLPLTAPGLFLRQIAELFGQPLTIDRLLILLKHPLTATGSQLIESREARKQARDLELQLRAKGPSFPDPEHLLDWGSKADQTRKIWAEWVAGLIARIKSHENDTARRPIPDRLSDLCNIAQDLAAGPQGDHEASELWKKKPGQLARICLEHLQTHAGNGPDLSPGDFASLLLGEMQELSDRTEADYHPLLKIRGPREARIVNDDLVILSGLNEGGWPRALSPDPWLSRQMRSQAGLTSPERLIGLAAHDFQQAIGAAQVILTRARRDAEAETIPSRWLNRLTNLMAGLPERNGPQALQQMRDRGNHWLTLAERLSRPDKTVAPARRPSPIPPAPPFHELPVTDVSLLIRDPYAVYAKRVLGLRPLNPLRPEPDPSLRGQTLHKIVEKLLKAKPDADTPPERLKADLLRITAEVLAEDVPWPSARAFWQARIERIADQIVSDELDRLAQGHPHVVEARGAITTPGMEFRLTAKPDRIDLLNDGQAMIYDYKSGSPPTDAQIEHFDKQLILEAAMARRGGFADLGPVDVAGIRYIQLGGDGKTHARNYSPEFEAENWNGFLRLIAAYLTGEAGFSAKRAPVKTSHAGDYDHLARLGEWTLADPTVPEKVGHDE
ncbi:double-strand break repair protein AddB [Paracoccus seriniphilus]|uniref:ATP-dependent helicase/nuclease subunit B n=1 Tax=Paracoccus seriniphilus TaxID=184748 RepID=A0A239PY33_9RHOB|nr:double-strand break repair protein AddB [Paracoccus seriniphilus]WCR14035.1 double-strand break repair protein AddB [Paracoccus seriniphilus]SNT74933.1 ATP-dependent helicase/nuclease subunit B [Paracoccus seriniphilus]